MSETKLERYKSIGSPEDLSVGELNALVRSMREDAHQQQLKLQNARAAESTLAAQLAASQAEVGGYRRTLAKIKSLVVGDRSPRWWSDLNVTHTRGVIADVVDAALSPPAPKGEATEAAK